MNKQTLTQLLAKPQDISASHQADLATVIETYPYFQAARALQLKGLKNGQNFLYNDALKKTAAYTTDRDILFSYITSQAFVQDAISNAILQHNIKWNSIEVEVEDVSKQVSLALDHQIKEELKKAEAILNPALFEKKRQEVLSLLENNENLLKEGETTPPSLQELKKEPLPFSKEDKHSFTQWLKLSKAKPIKREDKNVAEVEVEVEVEKSPLLYKQSPIAGNQKKYQLIEKFIQESPKIKPPDKNDATPAAEIPLSNGPTSLMTETLAKVYLQQNNYEKAIQAYKILILKYPEKSGFFADQIRAIQKLTNKK